MAIDCLHQPPILAFLQTAGASLAILGAALAWVANNAIAWFVWQIGQLKAGYDIMKAIQAEIASNSRSEQVYESPAGAEKLLAALEESIDSDKPLTPYVTVVDRNVIFDTYLASISLLPANVIEKVVNYYNLTTGLSKQLADFRSDAFKELGRSRQQTVIRNLYMLGADVGAAALEAQSLLEIRTNALRIGLSLGLAGGALTLLIAVPTAVDAARRLASETLRPAVEWASTCDMAPKTSKP